MRTARFIIFLLLVSTECYAQFQRSIRVSATDSLRPRFSLLLPDKVARSLQKELPAGTAATYLSLHYVQDGDTADVPVAMSYAIKGRYLTAVSYYNLGEASDYVLRWQEGNPGRIMRTGYSTPSVKTDKKATVVRIFPGGDTLPHNLLFFQVRFSSPMTPDPAAFNHVCIQPDTPGSAPIPFAWRQRSFWTDSNRLLVLMIHPGRVKSGIQYAGPLLFPGVKYILTIDSTIKDSYGQSVMAKGEKHFLAGGEDHDLPRLIAATNTIKAGTQAPVMIRFSEPMDFMGITEGVTITANNGISITTVVQPADVTGTTFAIRPAGLWKPGNYTIKLGARVTDLAANTLHRHFEMTSAADQQKDLIVDKQYFIVR